MNIGTLKLFCTFIVIYFMKTKLPILFAIIYVFFFSNVIHAQVFNSANFIKGGKDDAIKVISAYILPIERVLCYTGANSNMMIIDNSNSSDVRIGLGFNVTSLNINSNDFSFDINDLKLTEFEAANPQNTIAQTISGNESTIIIQSKDKYLLPSMSYPFYTQKPILSLNSPAGKNITNLLMPQFNLFAEKDGNLIELKLLPPIKIDNSTIGIFNIGINFQHNLKTSLPFLSDFLLDVYLSGGYNFNRIIYFLNILPNEQALTFSSQSDNGPYIDQEIHIQARSIPLNLSLIKRFNSISIFASGGYNIMSSYVSMIGKYPVYATDPTNQYQIISKDIEDPFEYSNDFNKFSINAGINYQNQHISLELKYTYSYYRSLNLAIAYIL